VATGHDDGSDGRGGEGRDNREPALVHVDVPVPAAPDLGGREHATLAAHVTESTLARAVSTTTTDTGDTGDGTTSAPGLGGGLLTGALGDGVSLAPVLGDVGVDILDDVTTDGGSHDGGHGDGADILAVDTVDGDGGAGSSASSGLQVKKKEGDERR
jgi:hypothetical protein